MAAHRSPSKVVSRALSVLMYSRWTPGPSRLSSSARNSSSQPGRNLPSTLAAAAPGTTFTL